MLITLNNGKTVDIPFQQFDDMNDNQWKIFMDSEYGEQINDPFFMSQIERPNDSGRDFQDFVED